MTSLQPFVLTWDFDSDPAPQRKVNDTQLDLQLGLVATRLNAVQAILDGIIRGDDTLADGIIRVRMLHAELTTLIAAGISWQFKTAVACASTANLTLSGEQTIDGVLTSASRVLVKDQTAGAENGIYLTAAGAWSRVTDADTAAEIAYAAVVVTAGTLNGGTGWLQPAVASAITLGTTALTWVQYTTQGTIQSIAKGGTGAITAKDWPTARRLMARVVAASNITIGAPGATIDGVTMAAGDRVLCAAQSTGSQNGIWVWSDAAGTMTRPNDYGSGHTDQAFLDVEIAIREGLLYGATVWRCSTAGAITIDTTSTTWVRLTRNPAADNLVITVDTIAALRALAVPSYAATYVVRGYASAGDGGGGIFRWVAGDTSTDNAASIIQLDAGGTGRFFRFGGFEMVVNAKEFGAKGDGSNNDATAIQAANDSLTTGQGGVIYLPGGTYKLGATVTLKKGVRLVGESNYRTYIVNVTGGPTPLVTTTSGDSDIEIVNIQFQVVDASNVAIHVKGVSRAKIRDCRFYTTNSTGTIAIKLDQNSVAGAYNHYLSHNDIQGFDTGVTCAGVLTSTTFRENKIQADHGIYLLGASAGSGGNLYVGNLLQSRTGTNGSPVGQGIDLTNMAGDVIVGNYLEHFAQAIQLNAGCAGINILPQLAYDHCTTNINAASNDDVNWIDWHTDGTGGQVRYGHHSFEIDRTNTAFALKNQVSNKSVIACDSSDRVTLYGEVVSDVTIPVPSNGYTITPTARGHSINGNGSNRTGAILSIVGAVDGQRLLLRSSSSSLVTFAAAATANAIWNGAAPVFGTGSGNVPIMELVYSSAESRWVECGGRVTRP